MTSKDNDFDSFRFIWLEKNANRLKTKFDIHKQFQDRLQTFEDEYQCEDYIQKLPSNNRIVLIINEQFGQKLIPRIHRLQQVSSIYVYSRNKEWTKDYHKVNQTSFICCIDFF